MHIHPLHTNSERPARFTYPFCYEPHPLCCQAAAEVQQYIAAHEEIRADADNGKMFGVLVVENADGLAFLAAYSGLLAGRNDWPYFVPPVFDAQQPDGHFKVTEREISAKGGDKEMSQELQMWLFHQYQMLNAIPVTPRRYGRLLCTQTVAVCLSARFASCLHGRVLVGTVH